MILPLIYYGNARLRVRCEEVDKITDEIKQFCLDMIETMDANNGIGLAAIQLDKHFRIIVIRPFLEDDKGETYLDKAEVFINPKLSSPSKVTENLPEGCLSIPSMHLEVERPFSIHVEALDMNGNKICKEVKGFTARQIMHENDHLNGVLFIDRLQDKKRKEVESELKKIIDKYN